MQKTRLAGICKVLIFFLAVMAASVGEPIQAERALEVGEEIPKKQQSPLISEGQKIPKGPRSHNELYRIKHEKWFWGRKLPKIDPSASYLPFIRSN